ncbi:MAG: PAS domain S-box protein [Thiohalocapsa sp.]|nr:PAS domain S-box protein [Thiohalocapsa sp.]
MTAFSPRIDAPESSADAKPAGESPARVLVIDDDAELLRTYGNILNPRRSAAVGLAQLLEGDGGAPARSEFEVGFASSGQAGQEMALEAIDQGRPYALAFVDMRMPLAWDGLQTAEALRNVDPSIFLVIATAHSDHDLDELHRVLQRDLVLLRKPFADDEVLQLARTLSRSWEIQRQRDRLLRQLEGRVGERTRALATRLRRERALAEIAGRFVDLREEESPAEAVEWALARMGRSLDVDRGDLIQIEPGADWVGECHSWYALGLGGDDPRLQDYPSDVRVAVLDRSRRGLPSVLRFSGGSAADGTESERNPLAYRRPAPELIETSGGIDEGSVLIVPALLGGRLRGVLKVERLDGFRGWDAADVALLGTIGHILMRALDQHRLLRSMREATERLQMAQEKARIGHCEIDGVTKRIVWSDNLFRMTGLPADRPLGIDTVLAHVHPDDREAVAASLETALQSDALHRARYRFRGADGHWLWLECRASPYINGHGHQGLRGVIQDVSERQRFEAALRASEERYRAIFEQADEGMGIFRNDRIELVNTAAARMLGYDGPEELVGRHPVSLSPAHQPDGEDASAGVGAAMQRVLDNGYDRVQWVHLAKDGSLVPVDVSLIRLDSTEDWEILFVWRPL